MEFENKFVRGTGVSGEVKRRLIGATVSTRSVLGQVFGLHLGFRGLDDRRIIGNPLLKEQVDGTDHRLGVEPPRHHIEKERVGQGHQAHPLMVRHERPDDDPPLALGHPIAGVVERLIETIGSLGTLLGKAAEVFQGLARREHRGHDRRVGGDDMILLQSLLEPQPRHTESLVLVIAIGVLSGVGRLGDAPGQAQLPAVLDLPRHGRAARPVQKRPRQASQEQPGHQVLEHRPAPRDQPDPARRANEVAAEVEPVAAGSLAPRDGQIARQARFRRQQVVACVVELPLRQVEADGEEVAIGPEQRPEVHRGGQGFGTVGQAAEPIQPFRRLGLANGRTERPDGVDRRARARSFQRGECSDHALDPAGGCGDSRRRQKLRADRCPALASLLVEPADLRLVIARTHRANPGSDGGQLGTPRSHLGQQAVRPRRRLATASGGAASSCFVARPASSTASRSTSSNHRSHSLRSPGGTSTKALSRRGFLAPLLGRQHRECRSILRSPPGPVTALRLFARAPA